MKESLPDRIVFLLIASVFAIIPFVFLPGAYNQYVVKDNLTVCVVYLLFTISALFLYSRIADAASESFLKVPGLVFVSAILLSVVLAYDHYSAVQKAIRLIGLALVFLSAATVLKRESRVKIIIAISCLAATVISVIGILQYFEFTGYSYLPWGNRIASLFDDPNELCGYLAWNFGLCLVSIVLYGGRRAGQVLFSISGVLICACMLMSNSRSGWVSTLAVVFFVVAMLAWKKRDGLRVAAVYISVIAIIVVSLGAYVTFSGNRKQDIVHRLKSFSTFTGGEGEERMLAWRAGVDIAKDFPFSGVGPGNFRIHQPLYVSRYLDKNRIDNPIVYFPHAYNDYITVAAESGLPGLISWIAVLVVFSVSVFKAVSREKDSNMLLLIIGMSVVPVECIIRGATFQSAIRNPLEIFPMAIFMGAYSAFMASKQEPVKVRKSGHPGFKMLVKGMSIVILPIALFFWITPVMGNYYLGRCREGMNDDNAAKALFYAENAYRATPWDEQPASLRGYVLYMDGHFESSEKQLKNCMDLNPNYYLVYDHLVDVYMAMERYREAIISADRFLELVPGDQSILRRKAICLFKTEEYRESGVILEGYVKSHGDEFESMYLLGLTYLNQGENSIAAEKLGEAVRIRPDWIHARYDLARALYRNGDFEESAEQLVEIEQQDESFNPYRQMAYEAYVFNDIGTAELFLKLYLRKYGDILEDILDRNNYSELTMGNFKVVYDDVISGR